MEGLTALTPDRATVDLLTAAADDVGAVCGKRIGTLVENALLRTLTRTISVDETGAVFVITGDIPAMWLRDSTTQLTPYLRFLDRSPWLADLVESVIRRQFAFITHDSYANAFNDGPTGAHYEADDICADPAVWEQKYEVDSLCYPITLAHALWKSTGRTDFVDDQMHKAFRVIVEQLRLEQRHDDSPYRFERATAIPTETLTRNGRGSALAYTGMTWSGFRPSDDACTYGYNIPANLFAAQALLAVAELAEQVREDPDLATRARVLSGELRAGVEAFGIVDAANGGSIYAYEVDGLGGVLRMDDANTPSLLSLPLIAPDVIDRRIWEETRAFVLSEDNPYWFSGSALSGVGSPHTKPGRVWPIALAVQGLVGTADERSRLLHMISDTDAGTGHIHESIDANDPMAFSRPWFSWAESMFCELALAVVDDAERHT
jgi:meiotically up-regulated gene 157 (Mug157) protein